MNYPKIPDFAKLAEQLTEYTKLKHEYKSEGIKPLLEEIEKNILSGLEKLKALPVCQKTQELEPDSLEEIKKLRPLGQRRMLFDPTGLEDKLAGAFLGRCAGCTLGAPVELMTVEHMERWAEYTGDTFPPTNYWSSVKFPGDLRYGKGDYKEYSRKGITKVPVDDDVTYTILGLLIAEEYTSDFTTEDVAKAWEKYLPYACTAEDVALKNIKKGIAPKDAADIDNPYCQWIGADIRSDPFAFIAPGYPEKAAEMAYYDAYLSHRRNGIYGEMFFAAAQSAAFCTDTPRKALEIGLTEIPESCALAADIRWALDVASSVRSYKDAVRLVSERFSGMSPVHTNNNACLTIFGLILGDGDFTKTISETVAMGMDNDCTAATAGSIIGAILGKSGLPAYWYEPFKNSVDTYLTGVGELELDDVLGRFYAQAVKVHAAHS